MSQPPRKAIHLPKVRMLRSGRPASTIKITNVKSIKNPDPELVKKLEADSLRAQLQKEIVSRSRTCAHRGYECTQMVLTGQLYCARHVLVDPSAPFVQCAHTYANGQRCPMAVPDNGREHHDQGVCFEHARAGFLARQRSTAPPPPVTTTESLLNQLQHYIRPDRTRTTSCASAVSVISEPAEQDLGSMNPIDPVKHIDARSVNSSFSTCIMECASDSDNSDVESVAVGEGGDCRGVCDHESEDEAAPAELAPLWNAGVMSVEEAIDCAYNTLHALAGAYAQQMGGLRARLHAARADYLRTLRAERDTYCSINNQAKSSPLTARERQQLRKLKAYTNYCRRNGVDAVLARKLHRKRARVGEIGPARPVPPQARCTFTEGGVRCEAHSMPAARHCLKHILEDRHQVLFRACGDTRGGVACREPIALTQTCRYHAGGAPYVYVNPKLEVNDGGTHSPAEESKLETDPLEEPSEEESSMVDEHKVDIDDTPSFAPMIPEGSPLPQFP